MTNRLQDLLDSRPWLLADGATGTNYFALGLETGDSPELWNVEHPERVQDVHRRFVAAGSDIILTNTFGGTRNRLKLHNLQDRAVELNREAARLARAVADEFEKPVIVAGSMGPTGEIYQPVGPLSLEEGAESFAEQAQALAEGGADVLWLETLSSEEELTAAFRGAQTTDLPVVCTLSFDTNGRTMMGFTGSQLAGFVRGLMPKVMGYGGNCGIGPSELMAVILNMAEVRQSDDLIIAKSNCGIPEYVEGEIRYNGTPTLMADYARLARDAGVRIIGGCCGTTPEHITAMREALEAHEPAAMPDMAAVTARLGAVSAGAEAGDGPLGAPPERKRGRRRGRGGGTSEAPRF